MKIRKIYLYFFLLMNFAIINYSNHTYNVFLIITKIKSTDTERLENEAHAIDKIFERQIDDEQVAMRMKLLARVQPTVCIKCGKCFYVVLSAEPSVRGMRMCVRTFSYVFFLI